MVASGKNSTPGEAASTGGPKRKLPPLRSLLAFEAASRLGSFSRAAEELGVTPSAVSHQIQALEDFLGVRLFERHAGRSALTLAGITYGREIDRAFRLIGDATELVAPQSQTDHLVIASGPSFAAKWLQPRLPQFLREHPGVRIRLSTIAEGSPLEAMRFDIAIAYRRPSSAFGDIAPLLTERLRPLCSPSLAREIGLSSPKDLARTTLIHSANARTWHDYIEAFCGEGFRPANEIWIDRSAMAIEAAVSGLGVVLESQILVEQELQDGRLVAPFADPAIETTSYYLVRTKGYRSGTKSAAFEGWLRAALAEASLPTARVTPG